LWILSTASAAGLLWLASQKLELWPPELVLPRPGLLWVAVALHLPYLLVRAHRMACVLDPLVAASAEGRGRLDRRVLHGSGLVSFFVVLLLPLRLGELSRPVLLARAREPGVGMAEALSATAIERVVDGLLVCGLLFAGLALTNPVGDEALAQVRDGGRLMAAVFGLGCIFLLVAAQDPERWGALVGGIVRPVAGAFADRVERLVVRVTGAVAAVASLRRSLAFVGWSALYWAITVAQLWVMLLACGLESTPAEAAAVVAIIGLAIQLPGGPAQVGSFQLGGALALGLFSGSAAGGATFVALMYLLQLAGGAVATLPGMWLLNRARRHPPSESA
jgi:uncharacterized membrane protein YbhN (UPF0104 family)